VKAKGLLSPATISYKLMLNKTSLWTWCKPTNLCLFLCMLSRGHSSL